MQNLHILQQQLQQDKLLYRRQLAECQQQEDLIKNLTKQRDALRAQYEAFLEQVRSCCCLPCAALLLGGDNTSRDAQRKEWGDLSWSLVGEGQSRMA